MQLIHGKALSTCQGMARSQEINIEERTGCPFRDFSQEAEDRYRLFSLTVVSLIQL